MIQQQVENIVEQLKHMDTTEDYDSTIVNRFWIEMKTVFDHFFKNTAGSEQCDHMLFELLAVVDSWKRNNFRTAEKGEVSTGENQDATDMRKHDKVALGILTDMFSLYLASCHMVVEAKSSDPIGSVPTCFKSEARMGITKLPRYVGVRSFILHILFLLCGEPNELIGEAASADGEILSWSTQTKQLDDCYNPTVESRKRSNSECNNGSTMDSSHTSVESEMFDLHEGEVADFETLFEFLLNRGPFPGAEGDALWSKEMEHDLKKLFGIIM